ncbi:hypothetical protein [Beijerinckia sp. L45]|uniref:hypothetical protein n=1 Tax=Beijerinckia sp. L45 TaxID=1641855 RepID=UPI00131BEA4B|nr:hypothetical protein [Beijerinckia sp. L45]
MKTLTATICAATLAVVLASSAQAQSPQIPTPANPNPINPIATDGSPLPVHNVNVQTGRSAFAPASNIFTSIGSVFTGR